MAKWTFAPKYVVDAIEDEDSPEIARFHERCFAYSEMNSPTAKGVLIVAELVESDDQESCNWVVSDDGVVIARGIEFSSEAEWAIDKAQRKAERAIITQRVPLVVEPAIPLAHQRSARPARRIVTGERFKAPSEEETARRVVADWTKHKSGGNSRAVA